MAPDRVRVHGTPPDGYLGLVQAAAPADVFAPIRDGEATQNGKFCARSPAQALSDTGRGGL